MKANELRIGNWIKDRGGKEWQIDFWEFKNKVSAKEPEFNTNGIILRGHPLTEYVDYLQPIPLTEEWLLRLPDSEFDFVGFGNRQIWQHKRFMSIKLEYAHGQVFVYFNDEMINIKDYLHEIQNLFFALTGEELTFQTEE